MSPAQRFKRALVAILLELARAYGLTVQVYPVHISRDTPDADVCRVLKRVKV